MKTPKMKTPSIGASCAEKIYAIYINEKRGLDNKEIASIIDSEHEKAVAPLVEALRKTKGFIDDLSKSNPGFLGKLVLQDYGQYNEAMIEMDRALAQASQKQKEQNL